MTYPDEAVEVLRTVWAADGRAAAELDDACGPTKSCRNMKDVTFDGMAEPGTDLTVAWQERLRREGKLSTSGGSIRDLVLGPRNAVDPAGGPANGPQADSKAKA
jgi:hypothetical protein